VAGHFPLLSTLAATSPPSRYFLLRLRRSPAGISPPPPPRRRAAGIPRGSTTSAARWNGERKDVIDTVHVTEYGSAAGLKHRNDRLHQPRDQSLVKAWEFNK
jgi:hypothetical protein